MSDCKWTEGEWRVFGRTTNSVKGYEICWSDDGECVTDHVYEESDAYLMAAAKDLYGALEQAVTSLRDNGYPNNSVPVRAAKSALAKARGEQK